MINLRSQTKKIMIGNVSIGGSKNVVIQSMTNTKTSNIEQTIKQIKKLFDYGCSLVRVAVLDISDVNALKIIVKRSPCPIIADIHYNHAFAIGAIKAGVSKIRINPANIKDEKLLKEIVTCAKKNDVAIRLGFNKGSYSHISLNELINQAKHYIKKLEAWNFKKIIISIKSSDYEETIKLNEMLSKSTKYPIHIGVTEAGIHDDAIIKSILGLYPLLKKGIGDTIRISISGSPLEEPIIAKKILKFTGINKNCVEIISCPTCGRLQWDITSFIKKIEDHTNNIEKNIKIAIIGCSVNGIGEMNHADIGLYGSKDKVFIYKKGKLTKSISHKYAYAEFVRCLIQITKQKY